MARLNLALTLVLLTGTGSITAAQTALPLVGTARAEGLRGQCRRLLDALERIRAPVPADTSRGLKAALREAAQAPAVSAEKIQKLLDPFCLTLITINPESRVKALRGPAPARLKQGHKMLVLAKVTNEGGVTHALKVTGPQIRSPEESKNRAWLEAAVHSDAPLLKDLSGQRVEYVILGLTAYEPGKREATLKFDVGQGTQDLGFRAEVPILFTVQPAGP